MRARRLRARWVFPMTGPPIEDGAILIAEDGRIQAVGPHRSVPSPTGVPNLEMSESTLLPGLVNTHSHLELTGLDGAAPEDDFAAWIGHIRSLKEGRSPDEYLRWAKRGVAAAWATGVTTFGDTGDSGAAFAALRDLGGSGICYFEVFGPDPGQAESALKEVQQRVEMVRSEAPSRVRVGVSPHAPFTVSGPLYRAVATWARREGLPLAVHLAESREESQFVQRAEGPFADAWTRRGLPPLASHGATAEARRSPVRWVDAWGALGATTLVIHGVQVDPEDVAILAARGCAIAHCPRANRRHGHGEAPLKALRAAGMPVGLGTDSVASIAPVDLWAEASLARRTHGLSAEETLQLLTRDGARALGLSRKVGSLQQGSWGDLVVLSLPAYGPANDPEVVAESLLDQGSRGVQAVVLGGTIVAGEFP